MAKVMTTAQFMQAMQRARDMQLAHLPTQELLNGVEPYGIHLVDQAVRVGDKYTCSVLIKQRGITEPRVATLDIDARDFDVLEEPKDFGVEDTQ